MATLSEDIIGGRGFGYGGVGVGDSGLGLIALLALMSRGGFGFDQSRNDNCTTQADLNALQGSFDTNAIMNKLGAIEAAVPYNEAQMQLALGQAVANLTNQHTTNTQTLLMNQFGLSKDIAAVDTNVDRTGTMLLAAVKEDGERTRALITNNQIAELNQRLTVAQLENAENRATLRENVNSRNIEIQVSNNQQQAQLQAQRQEFVLNSLLNGFGQIARATNSNVVVGSTGVGTQQTASPTNVNA